VASGWPQPVEAAMQRGHAGSALVLSWDDGGLRRSVIAVAPESGGLELTGALQAAGQPPERRPLGRDVTPLDVEHVTLMLRLAMETVAGWSPARDEPARVPPATAPSGD
jgi:hypothetical protein